MNFLYTIFFLILQITILFFIKNHKLLIAHIINNYTYCTIKNSSWQLEGAYPQKLGLKLGGANFVSNDCELQGAPMSVVPSPIVSAVTMVVCYRLPLCFCVVCVKKRREWDSEKIRWDTMFMICVVLVSCLNTMSFCFLFQFQQQLALNFYFFKFQWNDTVSHICRRLLVNGMTCRFLSSKLNDMSFLYQNLFNFSLDNIVPYMEWHVIFYWVNGTTCHFFTKFILL